MASRSQAKADRVAAEWGIPQAYGQVEEMLARPDIDAVYIATPHNHHFPDGMQALKAGKHVLIEKPFALNLGEGVSCRPKPPARRSWRWRQCGAITRRNMM